MYRVGSGVTLTNVAYYIRFIFVCQVLFSTSLNLRGFNTLAVVYTTFQNKSSFILTSDLIYRQAVPIGAKGFYATIFTRHHARDRDNQLNRAKTMSDILRRIIARSI